MGRMPTVEIILLNWNGMAYLEACLSAISAQTYPAYKIRLVDNASSDGSVDWVRQRFAHVHVLQNESNLGYAGGNNQALRMLAADYAVLINPDIVVPAAWLEHLIAGMEEEELAGIGGCKLLYPDGRTIQHAGGLITHPQAFPVHLATFEPDRGQVDTRREVEYVTGAAMAVKREVLESIGLLDDGFFMYFEEADFCARARRAGYRVLYLPEATAVHDESAIAVKGSPAYLRRFHSGRWRYLLKHFDVAEILASSFDAEEQWLGGVSGRERRALSRAYRVVYMGLDGILAARLADGGGAVTSSERDLLEQKLVQLRRAAASPALSSEERRRRLAAQGEVRAAPFRSSFPVLGPLIARLRSFWASIAVQEQVKGFSKQQSEFNRSLVDEIGAMEQRFLKLEQELLLRDERNAALGREVAVLKASLHRAQQSLAEAAGHLERSEEAARNSEPENHKPPTERLP